ncbi:ATP-binding protein of ferrichrome ABC transporter [Leptolyngbya boryana NIES-2135]|jgi:iron complex transport system ATP-binding protein|uniref:ATP-binding protein of ferrichrome ABC transporter n=2 Tax=Leptolyngbya group TaxID=3081713 RepID=A0A1Z4JCW9_LEPBY|nr:Iron-chelate-transporting ATPase [Leptolyngbya boryana IAM M-101]BAS65364.1 Iron-chelate-transporting ATPase [Leptolyngbya boryana dg5]BAY54645.1 ATP-binding protein of ferrichrome ABC transporter [Leptolyngbya boryana NIES-2135]
MTIFLMSNPATLIARDLSLAYDGTVIVQDLTLAIPTGKITALIGANGCGKSTLLRGLARLLKPVSGAVYLDSKSIFQRPTKEVAQQLGLLPQNPVAPEGLTVKDLVAQGRYPYQNWLQQWSPQDEKIVQRALEITDLTQFADRALDTLSGGQRQRAWIAMALAQDTEILLLDEPTTFLDLAHQIEILDLLYDLNQREGRTIVMVLHDLNQACRYADYLVAVQAGRIFAAGDPESVMTAEIVRAVFDLDCQIFSDPIAGTPMCVPISQKAKNIARS